MAILIKTNGRYEYVQPTGGTCFDLHELRGYVKGPIEIIRLNENYTMVVNEEGKLLGLPMNVPATYAFHLAKGPIDLIVGDVILCKSKQIE